MTITVEFDPPQPGDSREVFNNKAFDTVAKFNPWSQQANALALEVNNDAATAEAGAEIVNSVVNFRGAWDDLTGALSVPASCAHASGYWILLESVADVTAHEPGVSAVWAMYESDFARLSGADFTGPITVPAGASGDQVPRASEVALLTGAAFTGPITVPAGATGEQAVRAGEVAAESIILPASGTAVDVLSIPSWARNIYIEFQNVSVDASTQIWLRIGDASGVLTTNYAALQAAAVPVSPPAIGEVSTHIPIRCDGAAAQVVRGRISLRKGNGNWWFANGILYRSGDKAIIWVVGLGALSGVLDRIRLMTSNASNFTSGTFSVAWRR